jgi:DMSO/TMAO reductase YedYZ molybdopterin-dependent catalytic subunit
MRRQWPRLPRRCVAGGQLGDGAMEGRAAQSAPEKRARKTGAVQVSFQGIDLFPPETPAFIKALDLDHALDGEAMIAYAMNGEDPRWLNGFPVRLVVPGC